MVKKLAVVFICSAHDEPPTVSADRSGTYSLDADPTMQCWVGPHLVLAMLGAAGILCFML